MIDYKDFEFSKEAVDKDLLAISEGRMSDIVLPLRLLRDFDKVKFRIALHTYNHREYMKSYYRRKKNEQGGV